MSNQQENMNAIAKKLLINLGILTKKSKKNQNTNTKCKRNPVYPKRSPPPPPIVRPRRPPPLTPPNAALVKAFENYVKKLKQNKK